MRSKNEDSRRGPRALKILQHLADLAERGQAGGVHRSA
ncbi:hypothetical protein Spb1_17130 [Planctopirus ephydatiae]|uniref:Uncharacterized protein n=1 Tax=Planctopirus ephydatiae TaxID=2528019 RepID=A0A518GML3_9PLAN|nr:hypothetical protein Spb1_17130 [Planctopirus ephydatiae]